MKPRCLCLSQHRVTVRYASHAVVLTPLSLIPIPAGGALAVVRVIRAGAVAGVVFACKCVFSEEANSSAENWAGSCPYSLDEIWGFE
jgi:hypothetical protein